MPLRVIEANNGFGLRVTEAPNRIGLPVNLGVTGFGLPVVFTGAGGLPVVLEGEEEMAIVSKHYANLAGYDTAACFLVTGTVAARVIGQVGATGITSTSGTTTFRVGTSQVPDGILDRAINNTNFAAGDVWTEFADSDLLPITDEYVIGNGSDLILTRSADDILGGILTLYCMWRPISPDGLVVPA